MDFAAFLQWERASRDTIDFKKTYVDMCGDVYGGLMLSEIVYWYLPSERGVSKLRVEHGGFEWIAVRRYEWWERIRLSPREADRALKVLVDAALIVKEVFKFYGEPTTHVRLNHSTFLAKIEAVVMTPPGNPYHQTVKTESPNGENGITKTVKTESPKPTNPVTETPTETPASITASTTTGSRPRFRTWVQHGEKYADGALIEVVSPVFEDAANAIFWAWLDVLQEFRAKPDTEPADLWEKNRAAVVGLVKHRRTVDQVTAYMRHAYTNPKDAFWREPLKPMNLTVIANNIGAWLSTTANPKQSETSHSWGIGDGDNAAWVAHWKEEQERREAERAAMTPEQRAWADAYHQLELQMERPTFDTWVKEARLLRTDGTCYVIGVTNKYAQEMLERRLLRTVQRALQECAGAQASIRVEVMEQATT